MKQRHLGKKNSALGDLAKRIDRVGDQIDELAVVTSKGFDRVDKRFEEVDKRFEAIDKRFEAIDRRFEAIDKRFFEIERRLEKIWLEVGTVRREMIRREEFEHLVARVEFLEKKLKVRV